MEGHHLSREFLGAAEQFSMGRFALPTHVLFQNLLQTGCPATQDERKKYFPVGCKRANAAPCLPRALLRSQSRGSAAAERNPRGAMSRGLAGLEPAEFNNPEVQRKDHNDARGPGCGDLAAGGGPGEYPSTRGGR